MGGRFARSLRIDADLEGPNDIGVIATYKAAMILPAM